MSEKFIPNIESIKPPETFKTLSEQVGNLSNLIALANKAGFEAVKKLFKH